jgi:excisionase family DNA binding protein
MLSESVYTVADLAVRWTTPASTIEAMLRRGDLRGFKVGRQWRVTDLAVAEFEQTGSST